MKRHYLFLIALLLQFFSLNMFAQSILTEGLGDPLIWDVEQISSNASDKDEGKDLGALIDDDYNSFWHSDWHGQVSDPHYLQFKFDTPVSGRVIVYCHRRSTADNHIEKMKVEVSNDNKAWVKVVDELVFPNPSSGTECVTDPIKLTGAWSYIRFTNLKNSKGNMFFHASEFQLYNPADTELYASMLNNIIMKYEDYAYGSYEIGTEYGQFTDEESLNALADMLDNIADLINTPDSPDFPKTEAEVAAIDAKCKALLDKFLASEVLYKLPADGYYRIVSNLPYKLNVKTGELDENDQPIYEETLVKKAIFSTLDNLGYWGTLLEDRANFIWKLTQVGDCIEMVNAGMGTQFSSVSSVPFKLAPESDLKFIFDFAGWNDENEPVIYIRPSNEARNSNKYFHQQGHGKGTQTADQTLCLWNGTYNMSGPYDGDKGTSEWLLEPVDEAEALELIEKFESIKNHDLLVEQNNALRAEVGNALTVAKDVIKTNLLTSSEQFSSPYSQNDCGGSRDGGDLSAGVLIDGDKGTFWHSAWSGNPPTGNHYVQLSGMTAMTGDVEFYICRRSGADNDHLKHMKLMASNDEFADDADWVQLADLELGNASKDQEYTTPVFNVGETAYEYVRIVATEEAPSTRGFWHAAEIQIRIIRENPNSQFAALGDLAIALDKIYNENVATDDADITIEMYEALQDAYKAFLGGMVDPTELRNALAQYAKTTISVEEGKNPGQWENTETATAFETLYKEISDYDQAGHFTAAQNHTYAVQLKAMAKSVAEGANGVKENTWYRIKFPTEEMYEKYGWNPANVGGESSFGTHQWGNYVVAAQEIRDEENTLLDVEALAVEDMREGSRLHFVEDELIEDKDASLFRFIGKQSKDVDYTAAYSDIMSNAMMAMDMVNVRDAYTVAGEGLITDAKQLSSNASDSSEGLNIDYLIDGNAKTFWHTDYHKNATAPHYLQVALNAPVSGTIAVEMTRRQNISYGHAVRMYLQGSNDAETWTNIGYVELPYTNLNETVTSWPVELGGEYSHLRFILTRRAALDKEFDPFTEATTSDTDENWTYFHAAEFQIYPVTASAELSASVAALKKAYTDLNKVVFCKATAEELDAAKAAYGAYRTEYNAAAGKAILPEGGKVDNTTYAIQNKANGLFIYGDAAKSNDVTLQPNPSYFTFSALGFNECLLRGKNINGEDISALHSQNWNHRLVTWNVYTSNSNSGLVIEESDVEYEAAPYTFYRDIKPGKINNYCMSATVTNEGEGHAYMGLGQFTVEDEGIFLAMKEIKEIEAGMPVYYIYEDTLSYDPEADDYEPMAFTMVAEPELPMEGQVVNGFIGCITKYNLRPQDLYFGKNYAECTGAEGYYLVPNRVVANLDEIPEVDADEAYDFCICIGDAAAEDVTGIEKAMENVSKAGAIYTVDGRQVRAHGTLNDMKSLGRGMYILNGVKVMVK